MPNNSVERDGLQAAFANTLRRFTAPVAITSNGRLNMDSLPIFALFAIFCVLFILPMTLTYRSGRTVVKEVMEKGILGEAEILGYIHGDSRLYVRYVFTPRGSNTPLVCEKCLDHGGDKMPIGTKVPVRYKAAYPFISVLVPYAHTQDA